MAVDNSWSNVVLLLPFAEGLLDTKGHTVTVVGGATLSSAVGTPFGAGNALYIDGVDDVLTAPRALDTIAFSIGAWVRVAAATEQAFFAQYEAAEVGRLSVYINSSGKLELFIGGGANLLLTDSATFTTGSWRYVEVCRDESGGTYLFNHGVLVASGSSTQVPYNGVCSIGGQYGVSTGLLRKMTGYLSNVRVDNGVTRHTSTFTVPAAPFPRPTIAGTVLNASATPVAKVVKAFRRSTMLLAGEAVSNSGTGLYTIYPSDFTEHVVIEFDTSTAPLVDGESGENALIYDRVIPGG